jgi:anti-sigma regulatory factor (Ser/Thr protein kinase)
MSNGTASESKLHVSSKKNVFEKIIRSDTKHPEDELSLMRSELRIHLSIHDIAEQLINDTVLVACELVTNSIKYGCAESPVIRLQVWLSVGDHRPCVAVTDNGPGFNLQDALKKYEAEGEAIDCPHGLVIASRLAELSTGGTTRSFTVVARMLAIAVKAGN